MGVQKTQSKVAIDYREFQPVTEVIIRNHLLGHDPDKGYQSDFTIGVYPLLPDETCWFLAADFDKPPGNKTP